MLAALEIAAMLMLGEEKKMEGGSEEPCPFVYAKGRKCSGHIVRIEAFKADLAWHCGDDGKWSFAVGEPRSHYHVYCSERGNHSGYGRPDAKAMKFYFQDLPPTLQKAITRARET
jgi:hypothetical protein